MPTIKERIADMNGKPFYSFEYFPPKTPQGKAMRVSSVRTTA